MLTLNDILEVALLTLTSFFLQKMLNFEPNNRISAGEAMRHPYFSDLLASGVEAGHNTSSSSASPGSSPMPIIFNQGRR